MKERKFIRSIMLLVAIVMCLQVAGPTIALASGAVDFGEVKDGIEGMVSKTGNVAKNLLAQADGLGALIEVNNSNQGENKTKTQIDLILQDSDGLLENGKIEISIIGEKDAATIYDYTKASNFKDIYEKESYSPINKTITYTINPKVQSGLKTKLFVDTGLSAAAEPGMEYKIKVRLLNGEAEIASGESDSIEVAEDGNIINFVDPDNPVKSWRMNSSQDAYYERMDNRTSGYWEEHYPTLYNANNESFKDLTIIYDYADQASLTAIQGISRYEPADNKESYRRTLDTLTTTNESIVADTTYTNKSGPGARALRVTQHIGPVDGNVVKWFRLLNTYTTPNGDDWGEISLTITVKEGNKVYSKYKIGAKYKDEAVEVTGKSELRGLAGLRKNDKFIFQTSIKKTGPGDITTVKNFDYKVNIPTGVRVESLDYGNLRMGNRVEGIYVKYVGKEEVYLKYDSDYKEIKFGVDDGQIESIRFKIPDGGRLEYRKSPQIMMTYLGLANESDNTIKLDVQYDKLSETGEFKRETYTESQIVKAVVPNPKKGNYYLGRINNTPEIGSKVYEKGDVIAMRAAIGSISGRLEKPFLFLILPKGINLSEGINVIQKPYNNTLNYAYAPTNGTFTEKINGSLKSSLNDKYDLYLQEVSHRDLVDMAGHDSMISNKILNIGDISSGKYEAVFGFGYKDPITDIHLEQFKYDNDPAGYTLKRGLPIGYTLKLPMDTHVMHQKFDIEIGSSDSVNPNISYRKNGSTEWLDPRGEKLELIPGELIDYRLSIKNLGTEKMTDLDLINIFPHAGDKGNGG